MNKRVYYIDRLRILATVAVVIIHICGAELFRHGIGTPAWDMYNVFDSLARFAVPLFIMLSGALFLDSEKSFDTKAFFSKNLLRIITSFLFWSFIYAAVEYNGDFSSFVEAVILGHFHMYFLYLIAGLYLAVPIFRKICEDEKLTGYFLALALVFVFFLPLLSGLPHMSIVSQMQEKMKFTLPLGYSIYFVGGYYLSKLDLSKVRRCIIYILGALGFMSTVFFTRKASLESGVIYEAYYSYFSANVLTAAVSIFVFAKYNLSAAPKTEGGSSVLSCFSKLTFGVYLVHVLVIDKLDFMGQMSSIPLYALSKLVLTLLISGIISYILNKIPVLKKFIV